MKERGGSFARLLDLHTYNYEKATYPKHTQITKQEAQKNCRSIWQWINAAMPADKPVGVPHGVKDCFFVLFGERHDPSVVAHTWCEPGDAEATIETYEVPEGVDPTAVLESWLRHEPPIPGIELSPRAESKVVTFYLLFQSNVEVKKLSDFLSRPSFVAYEGRLLSQRGPSKTVREILPHPSGRNYYQRLCVVFGCADEVSAKRLKPLAKQIVCGLITTWGGALERANERTKAAEMEAQAWSHELGNFIRYLDWEEKTTSRHLYDLTMNFLEIGTRATIKVRKLPDVISLWPRLKLDSMLKKAVDLGTRFAVLRDYRGSHEAIKTLDGLEEKVDLYKSRFAEPEILERGLRLAGGHAHPELNQKVAAFAQFIIFALYSAARHSKEQGSIRVTLAKHRFTVRNPLPAPLVGGTRKSEIRAILHQAFKVLWDDERDKFTFEGIENVWIIDCALPEGLWEK